MLLLCIECTEHHCVARTTKCRMGGSAQKRLPGAWAGTGAPRRIFGWGTLPLRCNLSNSKPWNISLGELLSSLDLAVKLNTRQDSQSRRNLWLPEAHGEKGSYQPGTMGTFFILDLARHLFIRQKPRFILFIMPSLGPSSMVVSSLLASAFRFASFFVIV